MLCALQKGDRHSSSKQLCMDKCKCLDIPCQQLPKSSMGASEGAVNWLAAPGGNKLKQHIHSALIYKHFLSRPRTHLPLPLSLQWAGLSSVYSLLPVKVPVISSSYCSAPEICCHFCDAANSVDFYYIFMSWAKTELTFPAWVVSASVHAHSVFCDSSLTPVPKLTLRSHCEVILQKTQFSQSCLTQQCKEYSPKHAKLWY